MGAEGCPDFCGAEFFDIVSMPLHGVVLEPGAGRVARPETMADAGRAGEHDLQLSRDVPQSPTLPFVARYAGAGRVRGSPPANGSGMNPSRRRERNVHWPLRPG